MLSRNCLEQMHSLSKTISVKSTLEIAAKNRSLPSSDLYSSIWLLRLLQMTCRYPVEDPNLISLYQIVSSLSHKLFRVFNNNTIKTPLMVRLEVQGTKIPLTKARKFFFRL